MLLFTVSIFAVGANRFAEPDSGIAPAQKTEIAVAAAPAAVRAPQTAVRVILPSPYEAR